MNKIIFAVVCIFWLNINAYSQSMGIGTDIPEATLDISSTNSGILIPRVILTATNVMAPVLAANTSELVFNTATDGTTPNDVTPGYYYWSGAPDNEWIRLETKIEDDWIRATTTATPAITTDHQYVTGNVGVGDFSTLVPAERFEVLDGNAQITGVSNGQIPSLNMYSGDVSNGVTINSMQRLRINFWEPDAKGQWGMFMEHLDDDGTTNSSLGPGWVRNYLSLGSVKAGAHIPILSVADGNNSPARVGIGTLDPYTDFDVNGNIYTSFHNNIDLHDPTEAGSRFIGMKSGVEVGTWNGLSGFAGTEFEIGAYGGAAGNVANGSKIHFRTWGNGISDSRRVVTITPQGRVGIGTEEPYSSLDAVGNIYTTLHGNNDLHNTAEVGTRYIGMKSGNTADGFTGIKMEVGQFGSNASGGFTNNGSRITFQTWGNSISGSRDVMTINEFGEILGKFRQSTIHNIELSSYYACSGTWPCDRFVWFSAPGDSGDDNQDSHTYQENIFIAPYSGRIVAIYLSTDNSSSNGGYEIQNARFIFNNTSGTMPEDGSITGNSTTSGTYTVLANGSGTNIAGGRFSINEGARIVWKEARDRATFSFGQGDQVAIGVSGDYLEDNNYQMTVVWEYNITE